MTEKADGAGGAEAAAPAVVVVVVVVAAVVEVDGQDTGHVLVEVEGCGAVVGGADAGAGVTDARRTARALLDGDR